MWRERDERGEEERRGRESEEEEGSVALQEFQAVSVSR